MLAQCWPTAFNAGTTIIQHLLRVLCLWRSTVNHEGYKVNRGRGLWYSGYNCLPEKSGIARVCALLCHSGFQKNKIFFTAHS